MPLVAFGLQLSGYVNVYLAWLLWGLAALIGLYLLLTWPPVERRVRASLRGHPKPQLEIVYGDGPEYMHEATTRAPPPHYRKVYRIGVRVTGRATVDDVRVLLEGCDPPGNIPPRVPLRAAHDQGPPYAQSFSLSPDGPRYFEVVASDFESGIGRKHFCFAAPDVPDALPGNPCTVRLVAEGRDALPSAKSFIVRDEPGDMTGLRFDESS
jgi:hypothetical protein